MIQATLTGVIILLVVIQIYKALIEASGLSSTNPIHDPLIWLFGLVVGVGGYIGDAALTHSLTGQIVQDQAGQGFLAVVTCIGSYHLVTHDYFQQTTPDTVQKSGENSVTGSVPSGAQTVVQAPSSIDRVPLPPQQSQTVTTALNGVQVLTTTGTGTAVIEAPAPLA